MWLLGLDKEFSQSQDRAKDNVYKNEEIPAERSANRRQVTVKRIKERRKIYPTKRNGKKSVQTVNRNVSYFR
jgi:hypothetical protein